MARPFFGDIWKGLVRRQMDGPAPEKGDKHALETREMTYFVKWLSRQTNGPIMVVCGFVTNRHMLCCYAVMYAFAAHT
jgi:hypothetical protein